MAPSLIQRSIGVAVRCLIFDETLGKQCMPFLSQNFQR